MSTTAMSGESDVLLREGGTSTQIAVHFAELQPDFGLSANASRDRPAAEKIMEWFTRSMQRLSEIEMDRGTTLMSGNGEGE